MGSSFLTSMKIIQGYTAIPIAGCKISYQLVRISIDVCKLPFKPYFNKILWVQLDLNFKMNGCNYTN